MPMPSFKTGTGGGNNLHVYSATGCLGLISNGDVLFIDATFRIAPPQKITSP